MPFNLLLLPSAIDNFDSTIKINSKLLSHKIKKKKQQNKNKNINSFCPMFYKIVITLHGSIGGKKRFRW